MWNISVFVQLYDDSTTGWDDDDVYQYDIENDAGPYRTLTPVSSEFIRLTDAAD